MLSKKYPAQHPAQHKKPLHNTKKTRTTPCTTPRTTPCTAPRKYFLRYNIVCLFVGTRGAATSPLDTQGDVPPSDTPRLAHLRSPWAVLGIAQVGNGSGTHHSYPQHRTPGTRPLPRTAEVFPGALSWQTAQLDRQRGPVSCGTPTTLHPKPASLQYWPLSWQNAQLEEQWGLMSCGTHTAPKLASLQCWPLSWQNAQLEGLSTARDKGRKGGGANLSRGP